MKQPDLFLSGDADLFAQEAEMKPSAQEIDQLEEEIRQYNRAYWYENRPLIADDEFDRLVEQLKKLRPDSPVLKELGPPGNVHHAERMLSLGKVYSTTSPEFVNWIKGLQENWPKGTPGELVMSPKIDGIACSLRYDASGRLILASTRGDGEWGEDITANVLKIKVIPQKLSSGPVEVRGEVYLPLNAFEEAKTLFAKDFRSPRNLAAGALKQKDPEISARMGLSFFAYNVIGRDFESEIAKLEWAETQGFTAVEHQICALTAEAVQKGYDCYLERRASLGYEIDGVVFKINHLALQTELGNTEHHPRYAIAYKMQGESGQSVLKAVEWSVGRSGVLTPVALIEPISLSGAVVQRVSLHNWGWIQEKQLSIGAIVKVRRSGGVIPYIEECLKPGDRPIDFPEYCPACEAPTELDENGGSVKCTNQRDCSSRSIAQISHYLQAVGIDGFGDKWLEMLWNADKLHSVASLYDLTAEDLDAILEQLKLPKETDKPTKENKAPKKGSTSERKSPEKLFQNIQANRSILLNIFINALGLEGVGNKVSQQIANTFKIWSQASDWFARYYEIRHKTDGALTLDGARKLLASDAEQQSAMANEKMPNLRARFDSLEAMLQNAHDYVDHVKRLDGTELSASWEDVLLKCAKDLHRKAAQIEELLTKIQVLPMPDAPPISHELGDKTFLVTGTLKSMSRDVVKTFVLQHGGRYASSVTAKLNYLVVGEKGAAQSKIDKAKSMSVPILSEDEFLAMAKG